METVVLGVVAEKLFAETLKMLISGVKKLVKKVREFKLLFKELASTMETLVPLVEEIDKLPKRLGRGNKHLRSLRETMRRAEAMLVQCSRVGTWDVRTKNWCTDEIKGIIADFDKFYTRSIPLILLLNQLRSSLPTKLKVAENSNVSTRRASSVEDEEFAAAVQESLYMQDSPPGIEDVHRVILECFADEQYLVEALNMDELSLREADQKLLRQGEDKGKGKQVQVAAPLQKNLNIEELMIRQAIQESLTSLSQQEIKLEKRRERELSERDEQTAKALQYYEEEKITASGSSSSIGTPSDDYDVQAQKVILESFKRKNKGKGKKK